MLSVGPTTRVNFSNLHTWFFLKKNNDKCLGVYARLEKIIQVRFSEIILKNCDCRRVIVVENHEITDGQF